MTAIFTPGYAAVEQFTSAKQGPWTDIYGLSATAYHTITGAPPPSAFDRMLDDEYKPLAMSRPGGFAPGLLAGIDSGVALLGSDRPQSIAGWRPLLRQTGSPDSAVTIALGRPTGGATAAVPLPAPSAAVAVSAKRVRRAWIGLAVAAGLMLAGGAYYFSVARPQAVSRVANGTANAPAAVQGNDAAEAARRLADEQELAKLRADTEARRKADEAAEAKRKADEAAIQKAQADAAQRQQIEEETRQKIEAEMAARQKADEGARQKAETDAAARRKATEDDRKGAEAAETALHLATIDRQHVQVALTSLGFDTAGTDGVFGPRTREMIAAWQGSRTFVATGFVTDSQWLALLKEAAPAIAKFDDDRKRADEERARADAAAKAEAAKAAMSLPPPAPPTPTVPVPAPQVRTVHGAGILKNEPPGGSLSEGQRILVDDGTCPAGQLKEVVGGNDKKHMPRTKSCVPADN